MQPATRHISRIAPIPLLLTIFWCAQLQSQEPLKLLSAGSVAPAQPDSKNVTVVKCSELESQWYSLVDDKGKNYQVKAVPSPSTRTKILFLTEEGALVTEPATLQQLAAAAWIRENVVGSNSFRSDLRNKRNQLQGIVETSQKIEQYEAAQDLLARALAGAVASYISGGAYLAEEVQSFPSRYVKSQFLSPNSAKIVLSLSARYGLLQSLSYYEQLEGMMPGLDRQQVAITDLLRAKDLYFSARSLELINESIAVDLMPQQTSDLVKEGFDSVLSEVTAGISTDVASVMTPKAWMGFALGLANAGKTSGALNRAQANMNLGLKLRDAEERQISDLVASTVDCTASSVSTLPNARCFSEPVVTSGGKSSFGIMRSTDNGRTWTKVVSDSGEVNALVVSSAGHIFAGTNGYTAKGTARAGLLESADQGLSWRRVSCNAINLTDIRSFAIGPAGTILAAGGYGVFRSNDNGTTWNEMNAGLKNGAQRNVQIVARDSQGRILAGTYDGIVSFDGTSRRWETLGLSTTPILALLPMSTSELYAGTGGKGLFRSLDGGRHWEKVRSFPGVWVSSLMADSKNSIFASVKGIGIVRSNDRGLTWTVVLSVGRKSSTYSLGAATNGDIFASIGECCPIYRVGLFRSSDRGDTWNEILELKDEIAAGSLTIIPKQGILVGLSWVGE